MKLTLEGRLGKVAYFEFSEDSELNLLMLRHKTLFTAMRFSEVKPAAVTHRRLTVEPESLWTYI